ncbi:MAG: hypothetical protein ABJH72_23015 [Reichenbachiella sp.]|uniref:hypothetical protein n=1 Tax=Reichenbachiella sp. TaxID=2184521 RepID=UPI003262D38A
MNFENFRNDLENKISSITKFELQEYHFEPHCFGNGILVYRIKGRIHKFEYDGREDLLTWYVGPPHVKYFGAELKFIMTIVGLMIETETLKDELN